ncbi:MAG TPA: VOC family protein [Candidatus Saccharimonadia bacterium]|nr:VOC family protein [Candidatus Saccharimonadia bacterium]
MLKDATTFSSFSFNDLSKAKAFYEQTLGLEVKERMGLLDVTLPGSNHLMIYPKPDHTPATFTVLNFRVKDIDSTVTQLTEKGVTFEHYDNPDMKSDARGVVSDARMKMKIAWLKDPAGNILSLIEGHME